MYGVPRQNEAAEAVCAGLHKTDFEYMGESDAGRVTWFTRGEKPKIVRVSVDRSTLGKAVVVKVEWPNLTKAPRIVKGSELLVVRCDDLWSEAYVQEASIHAVTRCLEIFRDVIEGVGVAGPEVIADRDFT